MICSSYILQFWCDTLVFLHFFNLFQADFFMTYILTNGLFGFSLEILQPGLLIWDTVKSHTWDRGKKKRPYLYPLPYYRIIPYVALCILIGMVYAVISPVLLPFLVGYFFLGYVVFINQVNLIFSSICPISYDAWIFLNVIMYHVRVHGGYVSNTPEFNRSVCLDYYICNWWIIYLT